MRVGIAGTVPRPESIEEESVASGLHGAVRLLGLHAGGLVCASAKNMRHRRPRLRRPTTGATQMHDANQESTLLPMLIGGLVLIVIGAIVVMMFV
jgi:hypothetical protein